MQTSNPQADVIANLVGPAEHVVWITGVHVLQADLDALAFRVRLDAIEERDRIVGAFRVRHAFALSADGDDLGAAAFHALIDVRFHLRFELVVNLFVNHAVGKRHRPRPRHRRYQAVFLERRPVRRSDQVEAGAAEVRGDAALFVERHRRLARAEGLPEERLLEPSFAPDLLRPLRRFQRGWMNADDVGRHDGGRDGGDEFSALHGRNYRQVAEQHRLKFKAVRKFDRQEGSG